MTPSQIGDTLGLNECEQRIGSATTSRSRPQAQNPLLFDVTKRKRLDFAYAHAQCAADDWRNVVFTNECSICTEWNQKQKVYWPALMTSALPSLLKFWNVIVYHSRAWWWVIYIYLCLYLVSLSRSGGKRVVSALRLFDVILVLLLPDMTHTTLSTPNPAAASVWRCRKW